MMDAHAHPIRAEQRREVRADVALFHADAVEYVPRDVIEAAVRTYMPGLGTDRIAIRCLRPLYHLDGTPILDERHQQRRAVLAGVFDEENLAKLAERLAELDARAADDSRDGLGIAGAVGRWHSYWHAQCVGAPAGNRLLPGSAGTVTTAGITHYVTLIVDIDPRDGAEPGAALALASELAKLLRQIGVPPGALLIMQSGRGAYILVAIPPQPLTARGTIRDALRSLARLVETAGATVAIDAGVHDAPRILRIAGTTNHKADADPTTPAWILQPWEPGVRAPWAVVERLAALSRPRLRVVPGGRTERRAASAATPLRELFALRGWLYRERADGICDVRCPNADQHTDGRTDAILYPPRDLGGPGWVRCLHRHCEAMTLADVYRALEGIP